jgi:hypothetical protein
VNKKPSEVNAVGMEEFHPDKSYNARYWTAHTQFRNNTGTVNNWMPTCFMSEAQMLEHFNAMNQFNGIGPHVGEEYYFMTLYGAYVAAFRTFNTCQLSLHARAKGFRPLLCMTNAICQKTNWGVNRHSRFVSVNTGAVSFLCLLGYWRQRSASVDDVEVITFNKNSMPLTCNHLLLA